MQACMNYLELVEDTGGSDQEYVLRMLAVVDKFYPNFDEPSYIRMFIVAKLNARQPQLALF